MQETINYKLKKPEVNDTVDITKLNENMDILDKTLKEVETKASNITIPVESINGKTGKVDLKAIDIKTSSGSTVESQLGDKVIKPTTAIGNNIAIFDTNQDKLKDSGKSIGNTSGKILELPTGLAPGDLLRVGANGQIERLPKGNDGQVMGYKNSLPQPLNPPSGGYELIATADLTNQFQVDFANISKDYKEILMVCKGLKLTGRDASNLPYIKINDELNIIDFPVTADTNELIGTQLSLKIDTSAPYMTSLNYFFQEKSNTMPQPSSGSYYKNFLRPNSDLKLVIKSNSQLSFSFKQGEVKLYGLK